MVVGENAQAVLVEDAAGCEEEKILCIIRDMVDTKNCVKHTMNLPASTSVRMMINDVAKKFNYVIGTISVHYERQADRGQIEEVALEHFRDQQLCDIVIRHIKRHNFTVNEIDGQLPQKMPPPPPPPLLDSSSSSTSLDSSTYFSSNTSVGESKTYTSSSYSSSEFSYASALLKSDTGYVGLVNQAMTCYLNSLIQTLYMTPEFRNAIYRWQSDYSNAEIGVKNIPYQLQRLFLQLQTSDKRAAETTDLTKSFGWDSSEVWQQHDVQELCRVMFDALELTWRNTDQEKLINQLYQGRMKDYVKCLECSCESAREDTYLDIPLVIRPFGSSVAYGSVQEAMRAFVQPEILEGRDQYFCEKCNKKCDAHKGLKFLSFPYLLTLQMKRFDFDYNTMHRIKLNDRMTFPEVLNLNHLIEEYSSSPDREAESTTDSCMNGPDKDDDAIDEGIEVEISTSGTSFSDDPLSDEAIVNDKNAKESECKGPFVYELFSIMIHSGSAAGGHYYAYIKCLTDGQWYSFNDQHVTRITYDDIRKTYGGSTSGRGYYSSTYASSTNAYMLMYRQIDKERNADFLLTEDLPVHMKEELRRLNDKQEAERKQKELDKSICKIKVFCFHPTQGRKLDQRLVIHKEKTLSEATDVAYKLFELDSVVSRDCCRIVKYDDFQDTLECSFEEEEDTTMEKLLGGIKQSYSFDLLLETKRPEQKFQAYKPGGVTVKVYVADMERETIIEPPVSIRAYLVQTVEEFKNLVAQILDLQEPNMRCVLERFQNDLKLLVQPTKTLKSEGFFKTNKVYIECRGSAEDQKVPFQISRFYHLLDRHQNTIRIHVNLPLLCEVEEFKKQSTVREPSPLGGDSAVESGVNSAENSVDNGGEMCNDRQDPLEIDEGISNRLDSEIEPRTRTLSMQGQLSSSDPNIYQTYDSDLAGDNDSIQGQGSFSQSSQSTSTSAGYSINSRPNSQEVSPMDSCGDPESAHIQDARTEFHIVGDHGDTFSNTYNMSDSEHMSSPTEGAEMEFKQKTVISGVEDWDAECSSSGDKTLESEEVIVMENDEDLHRYFHTEECETSDTGQRSLTVFVDKRITLGAFKLKLEPFVQVQAENFKVFRVYTNNQEFESIRLGETLSFLEDGKINIKLGRALKNGEYRVKVFQLLVNDEEPSKFLVDTIFAKGMTVLQSKKLILAELKMEHNMEIPQNRYLSYFLRVYGMISPVYSFNFI